jgi:hypothetical protein
MSKKEKKKLQVRYDTDHPIGMDKQLDDDLSRVLLNYGYERVGSDSGFHIREIDYEELVEKEVV